MSPELETLDQLLGGELTLHIIANGYPDAYAFMRGVHGLLSGGDVRLFTTMESKCEPGNGGISSLRVW